MTDMLRRFALAAALVLAAAPAVAQNGNDINGAPPDQTRGQSGALKPGYAEKSGLGQTGVSRAEDVRRTATGELFFSQKELKAIRQAAAKAELKRQRFVKFTVTIGAAVPDQAGARPVPPPLAKVVPSKAPLRYVLVQHRLILIDARSGRIVAIIPNVG